MRRTSELLRDVMDRDYAGVIKKKLDDSFIATHDSLDECISCDFGSIVDQNLNQTLITATGEYINIGCV